MTEQEASKGVDKCLSAIESKEVREAVKSILPYLKEPVISEFIEDAIFEEEVSEYKTKAKLAGGAYFFEYDGAFCAFKPRTLKNSRDFRDGLKKDASDLEIEKAYFARFVIQEVSDKVFFDENTEAAQEAIEFINNKHTTKKGRAL